MTLGSTPSLSRGTGCQRTYRTPKPHATKHLSPTPSAVSTLGSHLRPQTPSSCPLVSNPINCRMTDANLSHVPGHVSGNL
ncbi:Os10g0405932 [Oryza sativa Japonica Group]|uniref:Os10g0405932 protein n=1 Tax=Oryza sativa subsp. japonica TaxID=39947 RepID=A0A0P0XUJ1_ORYSJ|nr:Os10g0405932 [Oryza sativa Japonica Group]